MGGLFFARMLECLIRQLSPGALKARPGDEVDEVAIRIAE
jgi:hypothetical protein